MSDHDPSGDDDFVRNPMAGFRRVDEYKQPVSRKTMAYSIVDEAEAKKRHGGTASAALAATELMPAYTPPMDVKTVVEMIIERDVVAWKALPISVKDLMLSSPNKFRLYLFEEAGVQNLIPDVIYAGVRLRWIDNVWKLYSIEAV